MPLSVVGASDFVKPNSIAGDYFVNRNIKSTLTSAKDGLTPVSLESSTALSP